MDNFSVTLTSMPKHKSTSVFFTGTLNDTTDSKFGIVGFFKDFNAELKESILTLKVGDIFEFRGRKKMNSYSGKEEIIIEGPMHDELSFEEAMAMPSADLIPVEERRMETKKYTFPDGKFFYSDGIDVWIKPDHKVKATYKFVEGYNQRVTRDKWLIPDWFAVEQIKIMKEDPIQVLLAEAFSTW